MIAYFPFNHLKLIPMKIARSGYYKNNGTTTLANTPLNAVKLGCCGGPSWNLGTWEMFLRIKGVEGPSTYDYHLHLSGEDIAMIIESSLIGASNEVAVHAEAKAIAAYIREVLDPKHKPKTNG